MFKFIKSAFEKKSKKTPEFQDNGNYVTDIEFDTINMSPTDDDMDRIPTPPPPPRSRIPEDKEWWWCFISWTLWGYSYTSACRIPTWRANKRSKPPIEVSVITECPRPRTPCAEYPFTVDPRTNFPYNESPETESPSETERQLARIHTDTPRTENHRGESLRRDHVVPASNKCYDPIQIGRSIQLATCQIFGRHRIEPPDSIVVLADYFEATLEPYDDTVYIPKVNYSP